MAPSDSEKDILEKWHDVKSGKSNHDYSQFMGFINDLSPNQYDELFKDLPGGEEFIRKLNSFFNTNKSSDTSLNISESGEFNLYVTPGKLSLSEEEILALVKAEINQCINYLDKNDCSNEAAELKDLDFSFESLVPSEDKAASDALSEALNLIADECYFEEHWKSCLQEACYSIANSFQLQNWLMSHWYELSFDYDFSLAYQIWNSQYRYKISGKTCYITVA